MNVDQKILNRITELIEFGEKIDSAPGRTTQQIHYEFGGHADPLQAHQWATSCLSILKRVFGEESDHYKQFSKLLPNIDYDTPILKALGIMKAAKDDYEHGYLFQIQTLIEAEVFDDFLQQAQHLFDNGYYQPAAVIVGSVLEDGLRKLCIRNGIPTSTKPKLDSMNADLTKAGVYNKLTQKKVTAWADLRNKAAHGKWNEFSAVDVQQMIVAVRAFMEHHFS